MKNLYKYKEYYGTVEYSVEDKVFYGQIAFIDDLITYESDTIKKLEKSFHEAVDDYIKTCNKHGKEPQKSFRGIFNVRIKPELHKKASIKAIEEKTSLNKIIEKSVEKYVNQ